MDVIRKACWQEHALKICYSDKENAETSRTILPLAVTYTEQLFTVLACSCPRNDFRVFWADRISALEISKESFRRRRVSLLRDYLKILTANEKVH